MNDGRSCDNCGHHLNDDDFKGYGSWSYECPACEFEYNHSSQLTAEQQVEKFNNE